MIEAKNLQIQNVNQNFKMATTAPFIKQLNTVNRSNSAILRHIELKTDVVIISNLCQLLISLKLNANAIANFTTGYI